MKQKASIVVHGMKEKCKVMHVGHKLDTKYYTTDGAGWVEIQTVEEETDLGVK